MNADGTVDVNLFNFTSVDSPVDWSDRVVGTDRATWDLSKPAPYTDCLKFTSEIKDFTGKFGTVFSGAENCADINFKTVNVKITADLWVANGGKYPFTVKGGSVGTGIYGKLQGHGKECDVDAGNWSDQSNDWVKDWELGLTSNDGSPIVVRCISADAPKLVPGTGPYKFIFPNPNAWYHKIAVAGFKLLHKLGFFK